MTGLIYAPNDMANMVGVLEPTPYLRQVTTNPPILQQLWYDKMTGNKEWRPLPLVTPEEAGIAADEAVIVKGATV